MPSGCRGSGIFCPAAIGRRSRWLSLLLAALVLVSLPAAAAGETIVIAGTGDSQVLLRKLAAEFESRHPGLSVEVPESIGSSGGIRAAADGKCDLARTARPLKEKEKQYGLTHRVFAYSPVVLAANLPSGCLSGLSTPEILAVFSGEITSWKKLGACPDQKIYVANREPGDSSRSVLEEHLPGFRRLREFTGKTVYSTPETRDVLTRYPYTIGYLPLAMVTGTSLTILQVDGISPAAGEVDRQQYRLLIPLGLAWRGELAGPAREFTNFLSTPAARQIILEQGAFPALDLTGASNFKP